MKELSRNEQEPEKLADAQRQGVDVDGPASRNYRIHGNAGRLVASTALYSVT
jgi:hypothetical protein